jgi:hypothetical protein
MGYSTCGETTDSTICASETSSRQLRRRAARAHHAADGRAADPGLARKLQLRRFNGGDMVEATIRMVDSNVSYRR